MLILVEIDFSLVKSSNLLQKVMNAKTLLKKLKKIKKQINTEYNYALAFIYVIQLKIAQDFFSELCPDRTFIV
ncbi:hypothetical protein T01_7051 [Trichinella spiralis]|uniref:Uncharacterized protein n=1 Tax=Trichinella spiralis TaxID=6334 RepID=A0A0V1C060_TRISP|nr:hypothetical protein T01_7051 [Trichinella spiralis]